MSGTSATVAAMRRAGVEVTLDGWLAWNDATDVFDAELLDAMPAEVHDEYLERLSLFADYERKFEEQFVTPANRV